MIYATARRISDGLLGFPQGSPETPSESAIITNAVNSLGGIPGDWEYTELTNEQFNSVRAAFPARSYLNSGIITSMAAPTLTADKSSIPVAVDPDNPTADETITMTFDSQVPAFTGVVYWRLYAPNGERIDTSDNAVAGEDTWQLCTTQVGTHNVEAWTVEQGIAKFSFEGE